jgi:hypothetical protein
MNPAYAKDASGDRNSGIQMPGSDRRKVLTPFTTAARKANCVVNIVTSDLGKTARRGQEFFPTAM